MLAALAAISGIFLGLGSLPQAIKIFRRKSAGDISPTTYLIVVIGSVIWILYGFQLNNLPIIIPNVLGFALSSVILVGYYRYGRKR